MGGIPSIIIHDVDIPTACSLNYSYTECLRERRIKKDISLYKNLEWEMGNRYY